MFAIKKKQLRRTRNTDYEKDRNRRKKAPKGKTKSWARFKSMERERCQQMMSQAETKRTR
jgi:hypothetical protein